MKTFQNKEKNPNAKRWLVINKGLDDFQCVGEQTIGSRLQKITDAKSF